MKRFYFISFLLMTSVLVSQAQVESPTSGWYVGANVGGSWLVAEGNNVFKDDNSYFSFADNAGYMLRAEVGYDFNSVYGLRGFLGTTHNRWPDVRLKNKDVKEFNSYYFTADFLLNFSNLISGYSPSRKVDFLAFVGAGYVNRKKVVDSGDTYSGVLGRLGLQTNCKISERIDLKFLLDLNLADDEYNDFIADFPIDLMPTLSVGFAYKL